MSNNVAPATFFVPRRPRTYGDAFKLYGTIALAGAAIVMASIATANAQTIRFEQVVPTVPGIAPPPVPYEYYERSNPALYPTAKVRHLRTPAPPNGCGPNQFEVMNARHGERRCAGIQR